MPEQSAHHQKTIDKTQHQKNHYQKGENYENNRQSCSGIL